MVDYYAVLGVPRSSTEAELRRAYREQALRHHPDKNPDAVAEATEKFKLIGEAYHVLRHASSRAEYDRGWRSSAQDGRNGSGSSTRAGAQGKPGKQKEWEEFTFHTAKELFREVFGEEVVAQLACMANTAKELAHAAAPHVQAAAETACSAFGDLAEAATPHVHAAIEVTATAIDETARIAGPHVQAASLAAASVASNAADRCRKSEIVQSALTNGLKEVLVSTQQDEMFWGSKVATLKLRFQHQQGKLHEYKTRSAQSHTARLQRLKRLENTMWNLMPWWEAGIMVGAIMTFCFVPFRSDTPRMITFVPLGIRLCFLLFWKLDAIRIWSIEKKKHTACIERESARIAELQSEVRTTRRSLETAEVELASARSGVESAAREVEDSERGEASFSSAAKVGRHYFGKLTGVYGLRRTKAALL